MPENYAADFVEDRIYHVYNRTNNGELLFLSHENYAYFLRQYDQYMHPFLETFCWNLMPNHFHFLVRIKSVEAIKAHLSTFKSADLKNIEKAFLQDETTTSALLALEWKRFFNSYAMAFNKQYNRKGNLFHRSFKRVEVEKDQHFTQAVAYIHANAQRHNLPGSFTNHRWSSWHSMISTSPTKLLRTEVLDWFGGMERFLQSHKEITDYYYGEGLDK